MAFNRGLNAFLGIFAFFVFDYDVQGAPQISPALAPPVSSGEVVGGENAVKDAFPWQVLILYDGEFLCGGSIINQRTILTAAHCTEDDRKQKRGRFTVIAGEYDTSVNEGTEQTFNVVNVRMHKKYDRYELYNDIALLILDGELVYTSSVQPVPALSSSSFDAKVINSSNCVITGWGIFNDDTRAIPNVLQQLTSTNVISQTDCKDALNGLKITSKMICAYDDKAGFCDGDSGGPMGCYDDDGTYTQVGVVSWGPSKKCRKGKQVYTRVSKYLKWIRKKKAK